MFSSFLPILAFDRVSIGAVGIILLQGIHIQCATWYKAAIVNIIGTFYALFRFIFFTDLIFMEYFPLFPLTLAFMFAVYTTELQQRKTFYMAFKFQRQERQWREFIDQIPSGVILIESENKTLIYRNEAANNIFVTETHNPEEVAMTDRLLLSTQRNEERVSDQLGVLSNDLEIAQIERTQQTLNQHSLLENQIKLFIRLMEERFRYNVKVIGEEIEWGEENVHKKYLTVYICIYNICIAKPN